MTFCFKCEAIDYDFINGNHKDTILFLHGYGGDKNSFANIERLLIFKFNILKITIPTIQNTSLVWDMCDYSNLVLEILQANSITHCWVICHSFGFRIAPLIKDHISIDKIIVTGGAGPVLKSCFEKINLKNSKLIFNNKRFEFLKNKLQSLDYKSLSKTNKKTFQNIVNFDTKKFVNFNCQMLLFWGDKDTATKLKIAKYLKRKNNAKLIVVNSNHFAYLNRSVEFKHCVMEFLCG